MSGYVTVTLTQPPGRAVEYTLNDTACTVADLLRCAEISLSESSEVRVNGEVSSTSRMLVEGDSVLLTQKIKGA